MENNQLEQLYRSYYNDVYLYAFSLCKNHHLAQEVTSDTFFQALVSLEESTGSIKYWLIRVCKNLMLNRFRYKKRFSPNPVEELPLSTEEDPVLCSLLKKEEQRRLYQAISGLPPVPRECLLLFYFSGLSCQEIALATGTTCGAVRTMLYRTRQKLKKEMEGTV